MLLNVLGMFFFGRVDVTENRLFSLSDGSQARGAEPGGQRSRSPPTSPRICRRPFNATERYVRDLLDEYQAASKRQAQASRFVNPRHRTRRARQAETDGVQRVAHQKIENDAVQVVEGYRGIVFKYLGERQRHPRRSAAPRASSTTSPRRIKQLTGEKVKIGVLSGHEGPTLAQGLTVAQELAAHLRAGRGRRGAAPSTRPARRCW